MIYSYECTNCKQKTDKNFPLGNAKRFIVCNKCGKRANRVYSCNTFIPDAVSDARIGRGKG
jgi:predicted nucleic acid-binding Zn ribbon protein